MRLTPLQKQNRKLLRVKAQAIVDYLADHFKIPSVKVRVVGARRSCYKVAMPWDNKKGTWKHVREIRIAAGWAYQQGGESTILHEFAHHLSQMCDPKTLEYYSWEGQTGVFERSNVAPHGIEFTRRLSQTVQAYYGDDIRFYAWEREYPEVKRRGFILS